MSDASALKERQDNAVATITRLATECETLKGAPLDNISASTTREMQTELQESVTQFLRIRDTLNRLKEKEVGDLTTIRELERSSKSVLTELGNRHTAATLIHTIELMISDVERAVEREGYDASLNQEIEEIEKALVSMRITRAQPGARTCAELRTLADDATDRYRKLQKIYEPPKPTSAIETPRVTVQTNQGLPLHLPKFDGTPLSWKRWWKTFEAVMKENLHLTDYSKQCHFIKSMDTTESREYALKIFELKDDYAEAIKEIREHYEDSRMLHRHYHQTFFIQEKVDINRKSLQKFADRFKATVKAFAECKVLTVGQCMVMHALLQFSPSLLHQWKKHTRKLKSTPHHGVMETFLDDQIECLGAEDMSERKSILAPPKKNNPRSGTLTTTLQARPEGTTSQCTLCQGNHYVAFCPEFQEKPLTERLEYVREARLCFNCLGSTHRVSDCRSDKRCKTCSRKHHTTIHEDLPAEHHESIPLIETQTLTVGQHSGKIPSRLIKTALVDVRANGVQQRARAQFDGGSTVSIITSRLARTLKAPSIPHTAARLAGINGSKQPVFSKERVKITLIGRQGEELDVYPQVIDVISPTSTRLDLAAIRSQPFLKGLPLADPSYSSLARIDLLIDVESTNACHTNEVRSGEHPGLKAYQTIFGWTLCGGDTVQLNDADIVGTSLRISPEEDPIQIFKDLLVLENEADSTLSRDEQDALQHFADHVRRDEHGRYFVSLPRRHPPLLLGKSRETALRRFLSNERALISKGEWEAFSTAVDDYLESKHAEEVPATDLRKPASQSYYLPMHGVKKETSTTTKLRVVFDASAKTTTGKSLNDTLLPGPALHPFLPSVLTSFRSFPIAFSGDVSKMFRGIGLNPEEHDFHRYIHRKDDHSLQELRHTRLTFGVTSSPFLANQVVRQVSHDYQSQYPLASKLVATNYYVDDCLAGAYSVEEAHQIVTQSINMLKEACLDLRKWRSNSKELLTRLPEQMIETSDLLIPSSPSDCSKALGLHWDSAKDVLYVSIPIIPPTEIATRRRVASAIARIYDILGFFSPFILHARIILQETWDLGLSWDDELPQTLQERWSHWLEELPLLSQYPIQRYLGTPARDTVSIQLHGFSDASFTAYGGVAYLRRFYSDMTVSISFVASKTRIVPRSKKPTIPRLELCAAMMLAQLMNRLQQDLNVPSESVFYWGDSSVVLGWLQHNPGDLKAFVGNRIAKVQELCDVRHWRHISGETNPADLLSRGVSASELAQSQRWWHGPIWLSWPPEDWPRRKDINRENELPELKATVMSLQPVSEEFGTEETSFDELVRAVCHMKRFFHLDIARPNYITVQEYLVARRWLLLQSQRWAYPQEYTLLQQKRFLPQRSSLAKLTPFLDDHGVMRVGGRLQKAGLQPTVAHPVILSVKSHIIQLFLKHSHEMLHHTGASTVMAILAMHYHIPTIKRALRKITKSCLHCRLLNTRTACQQMGELPETRVTVARPFARIGMDYAGPFKVKRGRIRDPTKLKAYVCVFKCFVTRAIHLELVSEMTTAAFIAALTRFVGRRGCPEHIESDNGSNFVGAEAELGRAIQELQSDESQSTISQWSTTHNIVWQFTPPRSPQSGGLWEAAVGAMKGILRRAVGDVLLDFEELYTVLVEVEAILNSRPLMPIDSPAEDAVEPLTAGHFLTGAPLTSLPFQPDTHSSLTLLRRWNLVRRLQHELWNRWKREYLTQMTKRHKDLRPSPSLKEGDVVIELNTDTHQRVWPVAVVVRIRPGTDNLVRVVDIRRPNGKIITRGIRNLVHLFSDSEEPDSEGGECAGQENRSGSEQ